MIIGEFKHLGTVQNSFYEIIIITLYSSTQMTWSHEQ